MQIFRTCRMALMILISFSLALAGCGGGGGGGGSTPAPTTYSITGTVTGPYVEGVTITRNGGATAVTDASGAYSFTGLPAGSYTLTPSLPGYTYNPTSQAVVITNANATQNFTAASAIASYSISGTVSYTGAKPAGRVGLTVVPASCGGTGPCVAVAGTNIASPSPGTYTVRGLPPGSYIVRARMDYLGTYAANATSPYGFSSTVTVAAADVPGADIILTDPTGTFNPTTPTGLNVTPANGSALIQWDPVENANGVERVTAYKIYWGTDVGATTGTPIVVGARADAHYFQSGLPDPGTLYYKIASCVSDLLCTSGGGTKSVAVGPVTIGATTGANTVSGTVTFPGTATGPLMVVVYDEITGEVRFTRIASPVSPQFYSVAGVPSGSYGVFVLLDMDNDGIGSHFGDLVYEPYSPFTVSANTTQNFTLSSASASARAGTYHNSDGLNDNYGLQLEASGGTKHIVRVALVSGLNVVVPVDIAKQDGEFNYFVDLSTTRPTAGDAYVFKVTFSDGTTETLTGSVSVVLDAFATNLGVTTDGAGGSSVTVPLFTWAAPASPPAFYTYSMYVEGPVFWILDNTLPSTQLSTLFNSDGNATNPSLTSGTYNWYVRVEDADQNSATIQATPYIVP